MKNSSFQFKQFTVHQSKATLKVCTESCIFGATIPAEKAQHILDIGTGTGLLALMLAQRSDASIEAIELDTPSSEDAQKNFNESKWKNRITLHHGDVKTFKSNNTFDLIVCNPPFFIQHLKSNDTRKNAALHGSELEPDDLCTIVNHLSAEEGEFFILLPEKEMKRMNDQMTTLGWKKNYSLAIYQEEQKNIFRMIGGFSKQTNTIDLVQKKLVIYNKDRSYTPDFITLLKEYYLYL